MADVGTKRLLNKDAHKSSDKRKHGLGDNIRRKPKAAKDPYLTMVPVFNDRSSSGTKRRKRRTA